MDSNYYIDSDTLNIRKETNGSNSFHEKMILNISNVGIIKPRIRFFNEIEYFCYDIKNKKSLKNMFEERYISEEEIYNILSNVSRINEIVSEYLLSYNQVIISEEYIFVDIVDKSIWFCLSPYEMENVKEAFSGFCIFLMDKVNSECDRAVKIVYEYYEIIQDGVFDPQYVLNQEIDFPTTINEEQNETFEVNNAVEEDIKYYFTEPQNDETEETETELINPLIICASIILFSGGIYAIVFLNPKLLNIIGLSQEQYFVIGSALASLLSLILFFIIKLHVRRIEKREAVKEMQEE